MRLLALLFAARGCAAFSQPANWTGVQGANYVPTYASASPSTYGTGDNWLAGFFDPSVIARELGWMSRLNLTSVRVFHTFPTWLSLNASGQSAWVANYQTFLGLAGDRGLTVVTSFEWFAQPPACTSNVTSFIDSIAGLNPRGNVALLEASNEPTVAGGGALVSAAFLTGCLIPALRSSGGSIPVSVAMASAGDWSGAYASVLPLVDVVDWHCYNGGGNGLGLAGEIAAMKAIAGGKQLLLTEVLARPSQPLAAALPTARAAGVGFFIWALMFPPGNWWANPYIEGGPPFQGFLFPNGSAYDEVEEVALLQRPSAGAVVYRAAAFDQGAPFLLGGSWAIGSTTCSARSCEYMQSKGPREGASQITGDARANVTVGVPAGTATVALYIPRSPTGCAFTVTLPSGSVLATGTTAGVIEWEFRVMVTLPQPTPDSLILTLQPPATGEWSFTFAGATFFDAPPPGQASISM